MRAYGTLDLTNASPAQSFAEPLTVSEVKEFCRIPESVPPNMAEDYLIETYISGARNVAEILNHRDLIVKQWDLHLDLLLGHDAIAGAAYPLRFNSLFNFGVGYDIPLRHPLQSVDLFTHTNNDNTVTTLVENSDYIVDKNRSLVCPPWGMVWPFFAPTVTSAVLIRFTSGYPDTDSFWLDDGQRLKIGMLFLISQWYNGRLPFDPQGRNATEYPYTVTDLLKMGSRPRAH